MLGLFLINIALSSSGLLVNALDEALSASALLVQTSVQEASTLETNYEGLPAPQGDVLVLAQSYEMYYCCKDTNYVECTENSQPVNTLHGLWPDYTNFSSYPSYCDDTGFYAGGENYYPCSNNSAGDIRYYGANDYCIGGTSGFDCIDTLPSTWAAGYCGTDNITADEYYLANYEYPKHGSCTGLTPTDYFAQIKQTISKLPSYTSADGTEYLGTPAYVFENAGKCIDYDILLNEYESYTNVSGSVRLICDDDCNFIGLYTCFTQDYNADGSHIVGSPTDCLEVGSCSTCGSGIKLYNGWEKGTCQSITC
eukprot:Pgem_evm1s4973